MSLSKYITEASRKWDGTIEWNIPKKADIYVITDFTPEEQETFSTEQTVAFIKSIAERELTRTLFDLAYHLDSVEAEVEGNNVKLKVTYYDKNNKEHFVTANLTINKGFGIVFTGEVESNNKRAEKALALEIKRNKRFSERTVANLLGVLMNSADEEIVD